VGEKGGYYIVHFGIFVCRIFNLQFSQHCYRDKIQNRYKVTWLTALQQLDSEATNIIMLNIYELSTYLIVQNILFRLILGRLIKFSSFIRVFVNSKEPITIKH
jgi:hypothetical protein